MFTQLKRVRLFILGIGFVVGGTLFHSGAMAKDRLIDIVPVFHFSEQFLLIPGEYVGPRAISRLRRTRDSISLHLRTFGLEPGGYTAWWLIYNNPQACLEHPCSLDDLLSNEDTEPAALRAAGHAVGANGRTTINAHLEVGGPQLPGSLFGELTNPRGAEVHIIIKWHGPLITGLVDEQLHRVDGGCIENFPNNPPPICPDVQGAFHVPPN